jgi:hypothetical protein
MRTSLLLEAVIHPEQVPLRIEDDFSLLFELLPCGHEHLAKVPLLVVAELMITVVDVLLEVGDRIAITVHPEYSVISLESSLDTTLSNGDLLIVRREAFALLLARREARLLVMVHTHHPLVYSMCSTNFELSMVVSIIKLYFVKVNRFECYTSNNEICKTTLG